MKFLFVLLLCLNAYAQSGPMISPANGEQITVTGNSVRFSWVEIDPQKENSIELHMMSEKAKPRKFKVKGNTFVVKFKKLPSVFYWRVGGKQSPLAKVYVLTKSRIEIGADIAFVQSHVSVRAVGEGITKSLTGSMIDAHGTYSPLRSQNNLVTGLRLRSLQVSDSGNKLNELRFSGEIGWRIQKDIIQSQTLFFNYQFYNRQKFSFDDSSSATYDVKFFGLHHKYHRKFNMHWTGELDTFLQYPSEFNVRPSFTIRPNLSYILRTKWRTDLFVQYENYYSKPNDNESGNVKVEVQNLAGGVGMTYLY